MSNDHSSFSPKFPLDYIDSERLFLSDDDIDIVYLIESFRKEGRLEKSDIKKICFKARNLFWDSWPCFPLSSPCIVVGPLLGHFYSFLNILRTYGLPNPNRKDSVKYLFLGGYVGCYDLRMSGPVVDPFSCELILLLYAMKIKYPKHVFLLRGHSDNPFYLSESVASRTVDPTIRNQFPYIFKHECEVKYDLQSYRTIMSCLLRLPVACVLDQKYFCLHGGLTPDFCTLENFIVNIEDNDLLDNYIKSPLFKCLHSSYFSENLQDLDDDLILRDDGFVQDLKGTSYYFTEKNCLKFLKDHRYLSIINANPIQFDGVTRHEASFESGGHPFSLVITISSFARDIKNNEEFSGTVLDIRKDQFNICNFKATETPYWLPDFKDVFQWTTPFIIENFMDTLSALLMKSSELDVISDNDRTQLLTRAKAIKKFREALFGDSNNTLVENSSIHSSRSSSRANSRMVAYANQMKLRRTVSIVLENLENLSFDSDLDEFDDLELELNRTLV
eukprot:TRINITY_DN653_c0_g1_i1.p1 TRINITY_DN653_c0_g1~~TRINITY_DN653_c0_g1_i1.p1  ORF type:complete len:503 (-),score=119.52 TRINITY_DN653_c0_g1_i1:7-1515(-)